MRKIQVLNFMSDIPSDDGIYMLINDNYSSGISHIISKQKNSNELNYSKTCWIIRKKKFQDYLVYKIFDPNMSPDNKTKFLPSFVRLDNLEFLSKLEAWYPNDYELFIWHPYLLELDCNFNGYTYK